MQIFKEYRNFLSIRSRIDIEFDLSIEMSEVALQRARLGKIHLQFCSATSRRINLHQFYTDSWCRSIEIHIFEDRDLKPSGIARG